MDRVSLANLLQALQKAVESVDDENQFTFRRSEEFGLANITVTQTLFQFLGDQYDFLDKEYVLLISLFNSPYITEDDPQKTDFEYTSLTLDGNEYSVTGLAAAYLKTSLAVSFDSDPIWDTCNFVAQINRLDADANEVSSSEAIAHASRKQHLLDCHLGRLVNLFNWHTYRPRFNFNDKTQTLLSLIGLYSLHVESWEIFYHDISQLNEANRVTAINIMAKRIADLQRWKPAIGALKNQNSNRTIYTIPDSNFIISVDTQHGDFEVHANQKGNNHLGSVSFDGKRFKKAEADHNLYL